MLDIKPCWPRTPYNTDCQPEPVEPLIQPECGQPSQGRFLQSSSQILLGTISSEEGTKIFPDENIAQWISILLSLLKHYFLGYMKTFSPMNSFYRWFIVNFYNWKTLNLTCIYLDVPSFLPFLKKDLKNKRQRLTCNDDVHLNQNTRRAYRRHNLNQWKMFVVSTACVEICNGCDKTLANFEISLKFSKSLFSYRNEWNCFLFYFRCVQRSEEGFEEFRIHFISWRTT